MKTPVLTSILAALLLTSCAPSPEELATRAEAALATHDYDTARIELLALLEAEPDNHEAAVKLAETQLRMGDPEGALATLQRLEGDGALPEHAALLYADAAIQQSKFDDAISLLEEAGEGAKFMRLRALAQVGLGEIDPARASFERGFAANDVTARLLADYALFELTQGNQDKARELADAATKRFPQSLEALLASGRVLAASGATGAALERFEEATSRYPSNREATLGLVAMLGELGRPDEAEQALSPLITSAPNDPDVLFLSARIATDHEDWEQVRRLLQGAEGALEQDPRLAVLYGQAFVRMGQFEQARSWLGPIVRRYPAQRQARALLAEAQAETGDAVGAAQTLEPVASRLDASPAELAAMAGYLRQTGDPRAEEYAQRAKMPAADWIASELARGDAAIRNGAWAEAIRAYSEIEKRSGANSPALVLNNLAYALGRQGKEEAAIAYAERALKKAPRDPRVLDTLGSLLATSGADRNRGIALLEEAARLDPANERIRKRLENARKG